MYKLLVFTCLLTGLAFPMCKSFSFAPVSLGSARHMKQPLPRLHPAIPLVSNSKIHEQPTALFMKDDGDAQDPIKAIGAVLLIILFFGSSLVPFLDGLGRDYNIADSVVTKQDVPEKLANYGNDQDRLSRATIQEKLSAIPVFYLSENGSMRTDIYLSYNDAKEAAGEETVIKSTSLNQVMYPLILKRGRMRMEPPPAEVAKAEQELSEGDGKRYRLIPSKAAREQAAEFNMKLTEGDIPLFVADRLAFASPKGPQIPLFTDKNDCVFSYERLRQGKQSLPEQPNVRTATLMDELYSMEKGTRPGVSQLVFYANADDLNKAIEIFQP